ncbi:MAG: Uma2 family endonuclease, partial [Hyphomicrobiales bacterium]
SYTSVQSAGILVSEKALCGFSRNDYEPDIVWFGAEKAASIVPETMVYPVPDFIVEILSLATAARDRGVKLADYAAHGVGEYWIVDADRRTVEQYLPGAEEGKYRLAGKFSDGAISPASVPGLTIPLAACFDDAANLALL